jgi:DNA repair protein RecO (recombination protein O)
VFRHSVTQAIVLQSRQFGEIHKTVTLFTPGEGLVWAVAHGAKKIGSRLRSTTEVFCLSRVFLYHDPVKRSYKITDMEGLDLFHGIRASLARYYAASLWAELILKSYAGGESARALFALLRESLALCEKAPEDSVRRISLQFLWRYLSLTGQAPDLERCSECGRPVGPDEGLAWGESTALCPRCAARSVAAAPVPAGARRYLTHTAALGLEGAVRVGLDEAGQRALRALLLGLVQNVVEVPLSTVAVEAVSDGGYGAAAALLSAARGPA